MTRDIASFRQAFAHEHHLRLERFIEPGRLAALQKQIDRATFTHQTLDGETTIMSLATGVCYGLEGPGARIWDLISDSGNPRAIAARIARESRVTPGKARGDVTATLANLAAAGLVQPL